MKSMIFIEVAFGDNDFGFPIVAALKRLWGYVHKNNAHLVESNSRTVPQMFYELHKHSALETMIKRLFVLETLCGSVEFKTRGLAYKKVDWKEKIIKGPHGFKGHDNYLGCAVKFHKTKKFTHKWQNGEHAWLDLETGESDTF